MNTRSKTLKTFFSQAFIENFDHQTGALVDDVLTEILLRLPVTSILRFKSVSKHWRWLLTHKHFTHRYDSLSKTPGLFAGSSYIPLDAENRSTPPFRSLNFCSDRNGIKIVQSCNGLLLCCSDRGSRGIRKYYVYNPTTKQFAIVPPVPGGMKARKAICFMGLAFHQTDCVHYKLVCIRALEPYGELDQVFQVQTYSSNIAEWKVSVEAFTANPCFFLNGVYWNGAIHMFQEYYLTHFYFKIDVEELQTLPLPTEMTRYVAFVKYFGESRGHLHLMVGYRYKTNSVNVKVCEMPSDHSGWFIKYQVQLDELPAAFQNMVGNGSYYNFHLIDVVRGEKEEDTFLVVNDFRKIIKYNVYDKSFKQIFIIGGDLNFGWGETHHHVATLSAF